MLSTKLIKLVVVTLTMITISIPAHAHRAWIKPSKTVLSGEQNYVTFDAAVSNTLFIPEHVAFRMSYLSATGPDGKAVDFENVGKGKYRNTFDLNLTQNGTYRVGSASSGLRASWKDAEGKRKRWPGRGGPTKDETFETAVPKQAQDLKVEYSSYRSETFVTLGQPSDEVLAVSNKGLELVTVTHPNDLFATETATFKFVIDGEPAVGTEIEIIRGSMRYRNSQDTILVKTNEKGEFNVTWPHAGMYFLEASYKDDKAQAPATERNGSYSATLEVLPL
ncbi:DUF4198 domain-containing protein [Thalassotalea sp. PP2-459]|uniref:DUF4198 domain-containing protein n=1 Tax=Thalassotalea sp. PP2-459 TaxID=1742724 RepID=UPI000945D80A|nr:DUF4198 domain-containing protein [Thalassotalea sp. PP2-459]OKY26088.1 ABC transporter permease [Thalassotalea sp. PP2-459]